MYAGEIMPCSKRKLTLQLPRCKFCADKIKSFFLTFKYPIFDEPLKWLNNSELRYIPSMAQESNVSSSSNIVLFLVSSSKLPNLRCSQSFSTFIIFYWLTMRYSRNWFFYKNLSGAGEEWWGGRGRKNTHQSFPALLVKLELRTLYLILNSNRLLAFSTLLIG